ncbi:hypothetical protein [Sulfuricystis multivorans]|uniref:hypothetical protein n=1 Tax=Sulfuricystis multivorans TaxID=2211108 RepID=UPI000F82C188|nr:hypothetical protein [Sulfuricystis multivorans]
MSETRCYAFRRLNPFLGTTQVVDTAQGRAVSVDGVNWELQLRMRLPAGWGFLDRAGGDTAYLRFGVWSKAEGLARFPPARNVDPNAAEKSAAALLDEIGAALPRLPFGLIDTLECWLVDIVRKPLALIASLKADDVLPERAPRRWAPLLPEVARASSDDFSPLSGWVAERALPGPCWISRDAQGNGTLFKGMNGERKTFAAGEFPETLVDLGSCRDDPVRELHDRYLAVLAPRLLMLPLTPATRARLEVLAARQPTEIARFWRLYPAICDRALVNTARVQAQLIATS